MPIDRNDPDVLAALERFILELLTDAPCDHLRPALAGIATCVLQPRRAQTGNRDDRTGPSPVSL